MSTTKLLGAITGKAAFGGGKPSLACLRLSNGGFGTFVHPGVRPWLAAFNLHLWMFTPSILPQSGREGGGKRPA